MAKVLLSFAFLSNQEELKRHVTTVSVSYSEGGCLPLMARRQFAGNSQASSEGEG